MVLLFTWGVDDGGFVGVDGSTWSVNHRPGEQGGEGVEGEEEDEHEDKDEDEDEDEDDGESSQQTNQSE